MNATPSAPLDVRAQLTGARLLVMGGTGFLGKVFLGMLLHRFPEVEHIWLVCRPKKNLTSEQRFWDQVATSPVFDPLRKEYPGPAFEAMLRQKITPVPGDITHEFCGIPAEVRDELRGTLTAFVNASGVVSFTPPLDYALNANAFGMQNLVALAKDLGGDTQPNGLRVLHTSTCYVAGDRTGQVDEVDPLQFPFPKAGELEVSHWDPDREIAECVDMVDNVRHRSGDAFRQSAFLDEAKKRLRDRNEPTRGSALQAEFKKVKERYEKDRLVEAGFERSKYWGWHNVYTYTKSIGEQILRRSGVEHTICRPAVIESAVEYPRIGWCEGINTSTPLIYLALVGPATFAATEESVLDVIPVDQVAIGMLLALGELIEGNHKVVYQLGSSDTAPLKVKRLVELIALFKRKHYRNEAPGNPLLNLIQARTEPQGYDVEDYYKKGARRTVRVFKQLGERVSALAEGPLTTLAGPIGDTLLGVSKSFERQQGIIDQFVPFTATHNYRFSCANVRAAYARLEESQRPDLHWNPENLDWRDYIINVHARDIQDNVRPEIEAKLKRDKKPLRAYDHLLQLLEQAADRHEMAPALLRPHEDGFERISFQQLQSQAEAVAIRLAAQGLQTGDRVLLSGKNDPSWVACCFGVMRAGGVIVPVSPEVELDKLPHILRSSGAQMGLLDHNAREHMGSHIDALTVTDLRSACAPGAVGSLPEIDVHKDTLASVLYTSGTTGDPKGVMLTHGNLCAMVASLGALFPLSQEDRLLSVLPLHHAFEFTCGLLLPLSMGARIYYLDELTADRLSYGLKEGRITCMVGVPALWQVLERRVRSEVKARGPLVRLAFDQAMNLNRSFGKATGLDLGRLMFASVHSRFGGNIRVLISGGAALPKDTQKLFTGLGLHLSEGYGLTEASPVLTVAMPTPGGGKSGTVGKAVPGVQIKILDPDDNGVGEVLARGPNVMAGYFGNDDATAQVIDADGWLHTGDMGRLDHKGRLSLVGRAKDVVVAANGENIYLDDVEHLLGTIRYVKEFCLAGISDGRGGERLGLIAVPDAEGHPKLDRRVLRTKAQAAIKEATDRLAGWQRPSVVALVDADLPRTPTRKIKRKECVPILERIAAATTNKPRREHGLGGPVAEAIAGVADVDVSQIRPDTNLRDAFGFDSLMFVELAAALDGVGVGRPDADRLAECDTVADITALVGVADEIPEDAQTEDNLPPIDVPPWVAKPIRAQMSAAQRWLAKNAFSTKVVGRSNIPANRTCIVVSNHTSHLDMGLVKYALGPYGKGLASLAASDYFFEGNRWKVAWFTHFTNAEPLDRKGGFRQALKQATKVVEDGKVVLIFPEGTRQLDGQLGEFKPMVGKLALDTRTPILPLWIDGAYEAMPKGSAVPKPRRITVRIGPPLDVEHMERLTDGMKPGKAARRVAYMAREAVASLAGGTVYTLDGLEKADFPDEPKKLLTPAEKVEVAVKSLPGRFSADRVQRDVVWYFSLGDKTGPRWTVSLTSEGVAIKPGRPTGNADCVVKTSEDIFTRLVQDAYLPDPTEFVSGAIKTNDIPLLIEFSRAFDLSDVSSLGF